ncbi:MAG: RNA pseudouridine synthase [Clostridiales bacterium]|nr:RNA pseudouridine synthase [Clostridiales bacterium]
MEAENGKILILCTERDFAVIVKPVGMDSEKEVPERLSRELGGVFYTIHRLDRNVGGVMVYARTKEAAAALSRLVQSGELVKEYFAQVTGTPPEEAVWEDLLLKDSRKNKVFVVKRQRAGVKAAKLAYTRLTAGEVSLVRVRLHTGRSHQIRVQFASRGYPLAGDHKYGARDRLKEPRLFSCAISFPWKGKQLRFEATPEWI